MDGAPRRGLPRHPEEADRGPAPVPTGSDTERSDTVRSDTERSVPGPGVGVGVGEFGSTGPAKSGAPGSTSAEPSAAGSVTGTVFPGAATPGEAPPPLEPELDEAVDSSPVGRRVVTGMLAFAAVGMLFGRRAAAWWDGATGPDVGPDGRPRSTGYFRIYTVTPDSPDVAPDRWSMKVTGLVERPLTIGWKELMAFPQVAMTKDFQCVTGWRVTNVDWQGVLLRTVLDAAGVRPEGKALIIRSFDGVYTESLTMEQARRDDMLLAHHLQGQIVRAVQGGPVRLYTAPMYGYKSLKWLGEIEVTDRIVPGYWEERGYEIDAWVGESNGRRDRRIE